RSTSYSCTRRSHSSEPPIILLPISIFAPRLICDFSCPCSQRPEPLCKAVRSRGLSSVGVDTHWWRRRSECQGPLGRRMPCLSVPLVVNDFAELGQPTGKIWQFPDTIDEGSHIGGGDWRGGGRGAFFLFFPRGARETEEGVFWGPLSESEETIPRFCPLGRV